MKNTDRHGFSAVTWNILAQSYIRPERYRGVDPAHLEAPARRARVLERVRRLDADILCLQEVEPDIFEALVGVLSGHEGRYERRSPGPDGLAIFARHSKFRLTHHRGLHYSAVDPGRDHLAQIVCLVPVAEDPATPEDDPSPGDPPSDDNELDLGSHEAARPGPHGAATARGGRPALVLANTHLRWQGGDVPEELHQGLAQMRELLDCIGPRNYDESGVRMVAGDLNAGSRSPVLRAARRAGLSVSAANQRPRDTALINGNRRKLDYLFVDATRLHPHPRTLPELSKAAPIPSSVEPSDHLPLQVDFRWP